MAKYLSEIRTAVRQILRDELDTDEETDFGNNKELELLIAEVLMEISQRRPYEVKETLTTSNRTGKATATSASHLVDTTKSQFTSSDVGRTVYNSTDTTTAKVTVYNSTSDLTLGTDIMASGETYYIYNYGGTSGRDLNTSSITNLIEAEKAEYTTREYPPNFRNIYVFGDVVTLDIESEPDDAKEVFLYCHKIHTVTDSASTLNGELEDVLIKGTVAKAARAWLNQMRSDIVPASNNWYHKWVNEQFVIYQNALNAITRQKSWKFYPRG